MIWCFSGLRVYVAFTSARAGDYSNVLVVLKITCLFHYLFNAPVSNISFIALNCWMIME